MRRKISSENVESLRKSGAKVQRVPQKKPKDPVVEAIRKLVDVVTDSNSKNIVLLIDAIKKLGAKPSQPIPPPQVEVVNNAPPPVKSVNVSHIERDNEGFISGMKMDIEREKLH